MKRLKTTTASRYRRDLPYSYEAVVDVLEDDCSLRVSYLADTVCGLTNFLSRNGQDPSAVSLFELFRGRQTLIPKDSYLDLNGSWLNRAALCRPMTRRYDETGSPGNCPFCDRNEPVSGPC